jgi:hypothetical protein
MSMKKASFLLLALLALGCRHRITIESSPPGARVALGKKSLGTTPLEVAAWWWPRRRLPLSIQLPGYRKLEADAAMHLRMRHIAGDFVGLRWAVCLGLKPRSTQQFILVRQHGAAGTWTEEDAKRMR